MRVYFAISIISVLIKYIESLPNGSLIAVDTQNAGSIEFSSTAKVDNELSLQPNSVGESGQILASTGDGSKPVEIPPYVVRKMSDSR